MVMFIVLPPWLLLHQPAPGRPCVRVFLTHVHTDCALSLEDAATCIQSL